MAEEYMKLPDIHLNKSGRMYIQWDNVRMMDIVREVLSHIDLNAPWIGRRYHRDDWTELIACRTSIGLRNQNPIRNIYGWRTGRNRVYPGIVIAPGMVNKIISWLEEWIGWELYTPIDSDEIPIHTENVPVCPGCKEHLELTWKEWHRKGRGRYYNLLWLCGTYSSKCATAIRRTWPRKCPELIHDARDIPVFFHDWDLDGAPIPGDYLATPLTEWTITALDVDRNSLRAQPTEVKMARTTSRIPVADRFTEEQRDYVREYYRDLGRSFHGTFRKKYNHLRVSRYDIQFLAHQMGVTRKRSK